MKTKLSNNFTIEDFESFKKSKDKKKIATLIEERLNERFISPVLDYDKKHGFSMMAIACLTIEAFQAFKIGHTNSKNGIGQAGFKSFFNDHLEFDLKTDKEREDFYSHIRCGLLHDAETRGGWKIIRTGDVFDKTKKTINATKFLKQLKLIIPSYFKTIEKQDWDKAEWKNIIKKLDSIVEKAK